MYRMLGIVSDAKPKRLRMELTDAVDNPSIVIDLSRGTEMSRRVFVDQRKETTE
jgi:hypothetical protein